MKNQKINSAKNIVNQAPKVAPKKTKQAPTIAAPKQAEAGEGIEEMKVSFYQESEESIELTFTVKNVQNVARDCIGNFFEYVRDFKDAGAKAFNFSKPILFKIEIENNKLDSKIIHSALKQKMKLQWNNDGCRRYSDRFKVCMRAMQRVPKNYTEQELEVFFK